MSRIQRLLCLAALAAAAACLTPAAHARLQTDPAVFIAAPYVQLGDAPLLEPHESLILMWQCADADAAWSLRYRPSEGAAWRTDAAPAFRRVQVSGVEPHRVYSARLVGLDPGALVSYEVLRGGVRVFSAQARARKAAKSPYRFVVFGDCGSGSIGERRVAFHAYQAKPDFVVIPGDIVYGAGLISQYRTRYFPVYNADTAGEEIGAPLTRSTLFIGVVGNHDVSGRDLAKSPDGLAYYLYWSQPLNGPDLTAGGPNATPIEGPMEARKLFLEAAGPAFPRMASFSFDYGNSHWTCIDADSYVSWDDPAMRRWLDDDLRMAAKASWRFVVFHQPGFSSSRDHFGEQYMRRLSPVFERYGVDVVWAGHVHNYQRSLPLRFKPQPGSAGYGPVAGDATLDRDYDGAKVTKARGVIYIVDGAGGASLYNPEQQNDPSSWQPFTTRFFAARHSLSVADVDGRRMTVRQVTEDGQEVDRFVLTK